MAHSHHTSAVLMLGGVALIAVIALGMWGNTGTGAAFALKHDAQCSRWQSACDAGKAKACRAFSNKCLDVMTSAEVKKLARTMNLLKEELGRQALVDKKVLLDLDDIHALMSKYHPLMAYEYDSAPFMECVTCFHNETYDNKPCCREDFEKSCFVRDGVVRWHDLHPVFPGALLGCFHKAPDAGKACASGSDCLSGVCDLKNAVTACRLIKKTAGSREGSFTAKYACSTAQPGMCTEAIENRSNPGGVLLSYFKMDGTTLIEVKEPGPIF